MAEQLREAQTFLRERVPGCAPTVGVICGSGLSGLSEVLTDKTTVHYDEIPHFPRTSVAGHTGELVFGRVGAVSVVLMRGRFHSYEGHDMQTVTMPVKLMRHLGVTTLVVTNAAGGLNRSFSVGDVMIISDHIGFPLLAGRHPLVGANDDSFGGARFPAMSDAYSAALRQLVWETAQKLDMASFVQRSGCYCMVSGPTYETGAESQAVMRLGADAVGMSTVPEVTVARHCGMKVLGLSLITNSARLPGDVGAVASHEEVLETVDMRGQQIQTLVRDVLLQLDPKDWAAREEEMAVKGAAYRPPSFGPAAPAAGSGAAAGSVRVLERLRALDVMGLAPFQALHELLELQKLAEQ